jgi:hypothetical protein
VRLPQPVEPLAGGADGRRERQEDQQQWALPELPEPRGSRLEQRAGRARALERCEAALWHHEQQQDGQQDRERAAKNDRQRQVDAGQPDAGTDAEQPEKAIHLRTAHEERPDAVVPDLVGQPGLGGAAQARFAGRPDHFGQQNDPEDRDASF